MFKRVGTPVSITPLRDNDLIEVKCSLCGSHVGTGLSSIAKDKSVAEQLAARCQNCSKSGKDNV
jgi:DNA-directed RNA polymerase subunit RPC12/RpoP